MVKGTVLKEIPKTKEVKGKKAQSAQGTAFLRRRKVTKLLAERANALAQNPEPNDDIEIAAGGELQRYADYPILDVVDDFQGNQLTAQQHHARRLLTPEEDSNLSTEFWTIQGAVIGVPMAQLPVITDYSEVHSMDLMY